MLIGFVFSLTYPPRLENLGLNPEAAHRFLLHAREEILSADDGAKTLEDMYLK